jgi:hypothetical protein
MTIKKQAYFFIFFVAAVHAVTFNVTVKCEPCSVTCGFANCYRVTGDGYDRQVCGK